jgi:hypothetical protein
MNFLGGKGSLYLKCAIPVGKNSMYSLFGNVNTFKS